MSFLNSHEARTFNLSGQQDFRPESLFLGNGPNALEIAVVFTATRPSVAALREVWKARVGGRATPVLLVAQYDRKVAVVGPAGDHPATYLDQEPGRVERICEAALGEPDRHSALRFLNDVLVELQSSFAGLRNEGFFASHELEVGVPTRSDWGNASSTASSLLAQRDGDLLGSLGFTVERLPGPAMVLRASDSRVALAVLLERSEAPEIANGRFSNLTPISYALAKADQENLEYVVLLAGPVIRLYPVKTGIGTGQRGRTETYVEIRLDVLSQDLAGYLWLFFSAAALSRGGSVQQILESSGRYAANLGTRLRERIYSEVVPPLAQGLMTARNLRRPTANDLADTYEMALIVLFRLLFIAYAEDKELLPYKGNQFYRDRSLKKKAADLTQVLRDNRQFGDSTTAHWEEVERLFRAVDEGNAEWGVPKYNGGLFSSNADVSPIGAVIASIRIPDRVFGPVLAALLVDRTREGWGPVDFRSLGVREFGTVYEGLLENELAIADSDLTTEMKDKQERYRPAKPRDKIVVSKGQAFLHNTSGARKSTGSYFTKDFAVEHLLDRGLEPALKDHLDRLNTLSEREAGEQFFDFRVADITMGSGHFLVSAVDRIERAFSSYLATRPLPDVRDELQRLREAALQALSGSGTTIEIEDSQLLRRQIARRCIYGVDLNAIAVDLARLAIWVHTFVPGLPLSFLDHNLVVGNSLVGIGTVAEANDWFKEIAGGLFEFSADALVGSAQTALTKLAKISDASASDVQRAREAFKEAVAAVEPAHALFDILSAARIEDSIRQEVWQSASHWQDDLRPLRDSAVLRKAHKVLQAIPPFHFPIAFPEVFLRDNPGFHVIIGNPPWEEATVEEDRFWTRHHPGFHSLKQKEQETLKVQLRRERKDLVAEYEEEVAQADLLRKVLLAGPFPGMGTGDPDTYKAAAWRFYDLVRNGDGRVSVVLPRSSFAAKGSTEFRKRLFSSCSFNDLTWLVNRLQWVFPDVHPQYTVVLASWLKRTPEPITGIPLRGPFSSLERYQRALPVPAHLFRVEEVLSWTDTAALPMLPSDESVEVFAKLRESARLDSNQYSDWRVRPHTELHATNDKRLMQLTSTKPEGSWPVFKGESFDIWESDTGVYYAWADPDTVLPELQQSRKRSAKLARSAFFGFPPAVLNDPSTLPPTSPRIAFRDVTRATDTRTVRAALVPPKVFLTNAAPYFVWLSGDEKDQAFLLGIMCCLPLDWFARRFVEIHLNYHVLAPLPVPRPPRSSTMWQRVVVLAGRLASSDRRFKKWADAVEVECGKLSNVERDEMVSELDAVAFHLYGLSEKHLKHIFETFHEGWDYTDRLEQTLNHYRTWQTKL